MIDGCDALHVVRDVAVFILSLSVSFTDGTSIVYFRRERPQLIFDTHGVATHLINGVQEKGSTQSYTLIQPIHTE